MVNKRGFFGEHIECDFPQSGEDCVFENLIRSAEQYVEWSTSDDAAIYAGSAVVNQWQCHLPMIVAQMWKHLDMQTRAAAFLTAMQNVISHGGRPGIHEVV